MTDVKLVGQVSAIAAAVLEPGESVTHAVKANAPTSLKKAVSSAGAGAAGVVAGFAAMGVIQARGGRMPEDHLLGVTLPADLVLALTQEKLIICSRGGFLGKLTGVTVVVPYEQISLVEPGSMKLSGITLTALGLVLSDQSSTILVFSKPSRADGAELTTELATRIGMPG